MDLWKVIGYAGLYIGNFPHKSEIHHNEVTVSVFQESYPRELFEELGNKVVIPVKGIYHIEGISVLPIQIVVTRELPGKEYAGFRAIPKNPKETDILQVIEARNDKTDPFLISQYQTYLNKLEISNREYLSNIKRRCPAASAWMDFFKPEIDEKINEKVNESRQKDLFEYVQDGDMALEKAAARSNQSIEDFIVDMKRHGYKVPEMV